MKNLNYLNINENDSASDYDSDDFGIKINKSDHETNENSNPKRNQLSQSQKSSGCVEDITKELKDISISEKGPFPINKINCRYSPNQRPANQRTHSSNQVYEQYATSNSNYNIQPDPVNDGYQFNTQSQPQNIPWNCDQQHSTFSTNDFQNRASGRNNNNEHFFNSNLIYTDDRSAYLNVSEPDINHYQDSNAILSLTDLFVPVESSSISALLLEEALMPDNLLELLEQVNNDNIPENRTQNISQTTPLPDNIIEFVLDSEKSKDNAYPDDKFQQYNNVTPSQKSTIPLYKSRDSQQSPTQNIPYSIYGDLPDVPKPVAEIKSRSSEYISYYSPKHNHVVNNGKEYAILETIPSTINNMHASNTTAQNQMTNSSQPINHPINICQKTSDSELKTIEHGIQTSSPPRQTHFRESISCTNKTQKNGHVNTNINNANVRFNVSKEEHLIPQVANYEYNILTPESTSKSSISSEESYGSRVSMSDFLVPTSDPERELKDICVANETLNQQYWSEYSACEYKEFLKTEKNNYNDIQQILTSNDPHYLIRLRQAVLHLTNISINNMEILQVLKDNGGVLRYAERLLDHNKLAYRYLEKVMNKYNH